MARHPLAHREGQHLFNRVREEYPFFADHILNTPADPFYDDAHVPEFWKALFEFALDNDLKGW